MYKVVVYEKDQFDHWNKAGIFENVTYASMLIQMMLLDATNFHNHKDIRIKYEDLSEVNKNTDI